jgi:hypothetical protein
MFLMNIETSVIITKFPIFTQVLIKFIIMNIYFPLLHMLNKYDIL